MTALSNLLPFFKYKEIEKLINTSQSYTIHDITLQSLNFMYFEVKTDYRIKATGYEEADKYFERLINHPEVDKIFYIEKNQEEREIEKNKFVDYIALFTLDHIRIKYKRCLPIKEDDFIMHEYIDPCTVDDINYKLKIFCDDDKPLNIYLAEQIIYSFYLDDDYMHRTIPTIQKVTLNLLMDYQPKESEMLITHEIYELLTGLMNKNVSKIILLYMYQNIIAY
jgi:hypothetical protein